MKVEDQIIPPNGAFCLYRPKTRIQIAEMQYLVHFVIDTPTMEQEYIKDRNRALREENAPVPNTDISGIPMPNDTVLDSIVFRHGLGSGSYGNVFEGFDPRTGRLRVVKRITLKSAQGAPAVNQEIQALERFAGCEGILSLISWKNSLNGKELQVPRHPVDIYLVHEKGFAFNKVDWNGASLSWNVKRTLCRQLLMGLDVIHKAGCMHRDITPMNILLFPSDKAPQAKLCDFGMFCERRTDTDTRLAAWIFLPPELEKDKRNEYGQAIDIWMLGLALAYCWWPRLKSLQPREENDYALTQKILWEDTQCGDLGHLIARMMNRNPDKRPSAALACTHRCFHNIPQQEPPAKTSDAKRLQED
ncbi:MAG: hypothetical protein Q9201_007393 [Fulgogasparrea decipioides]